MKQEQRKTPLNNALTRALTCWGAPSETSRSVRQVVKPGRFTMISWAPGSTSNCVLEARPSALPSTMMVPLDVHTGGHGLHDDGDARVGGLAREHEDESCVAAW